MSVIFLEDIIKIIGNKYMAVNIAARRARHLNEKGIPILNFSPRKAASLALEEVVAGKIGYKETNKLPETSEDLSIFDSDADDDTDDIPGDVDELNPSDDYYVEDASVTDPDEPEEGL